MPFVPPLELTYFLLWGMVQCDSCYGWRTALVSVIETIQGSTFSPTSEKRTRSSERHVWWTCWYPSSLFRVDLSPLETKVLLEIEIADFHFVQCRRTKCSLWDMVRVLTVRAPFPVGFKEMSLLVEGRHDWARVRTRKIGVAVGIFFQIIVFFAKQVCLEKKTIIWKKIPAQYPDIAAEI